MGLRKCDGSPASGTISTGKYCNCGAQFDDADRELCYPHGLLSSQYSYNYYGTLPSNLLSSYPLNIPMSTAATHYNPQANTYSFYPNVVPPNKETFEKADLEQLAAAYTTVIRPHDKIIVCVDNDVTNDQIAHLAKMLDRNAITGLVLRSARAGTGYPPSIAFPDPKDKRLDIMARILDCWEQRPDLSLSDLLGWFQQYDGGKLDDDRFAAATEVHFKKVFGGIHGENR